MIARIGLVVAAAVGVVAAGITGAMLTVVAEICPDWESEGASAAPGSPYSRWMCTTYDDTFSLAWIVVTGVVLLVLVMLLVRPRRPWLTSLGLLVVPALLMGLLHVTLPRDCLSGRTESGDCARDREMF